MAFEIDPQYVKNGTKREWIERPSLTFEELLPEIIRAIRTALIERIEFEREGGLRRDRARARECALLAERDQQELDDRRWLVLCALAGQLEAQGNIRRLLQALRAACSEPSQVIGDRTAGAWLEWVQAQLEKRDALLTNVSAIFDEISKSR